MGIFASNILNEVYIGETKELKETQHYLSQFRKNMIDNNMTNMKKIKKDPWYKKFIKSMKDTFGYKTFEFGISFEDCENAYCYSLSTQIKKDKKKYNKNIIVSKNGFKYNNKYACKLVITERLLTNTNYTDREIMAIMLHEVGHSFYEALDENAIDMINIRENVYLVNEIIQSIIYWIGMYTTITSFGELMDGANEISKSLEPKASKICKGVTGIFKTLFSMGFDVLKIVLLLAGGYIPTVLMNIVSKLNPISLLNTIFGYKDEKSADSFATMYGYGADLSSALQKLDLKKDGSTTITKKVLNFILFPCTVIVLALDEHPDSITRAKNQLDYLEKEYSDIDDKETKAEIKSQINSIRKELNKTENLLSNIQDKDIDKMRYMYTIIISKLYKIDVRELLSKYDPYVENQKAYDKYKK